MSNKIMTMGVIGEALKKDEKRAPIHPAHLPQIDKRLRDHIYMEKGYGERFGVDDAALAEQVAGVLSREELFAQCDIMLLAKPVSADFASFREGQILWGWPHCVQGDAITQVGIDKKMTMIAWEAMNIWDGDRWQAHIFQKNNEIAGYASVLHALQLKGITGAYGAARRAAVINFGATGHGAVYGLLGQGFDEITVFVPLPVENMQHEQLTGVSYREFGFATDEGLQTVARSDNETIPMAQALAEFDVIVNCIFQDTNRPMMYVTGNEIDLLKPDTLIVDVSCDEGMAFDFARPTSFEEPTFTVSDRVLYYAVDHSPSYLWRAATYEISKALLPYIAPVMRGAYMEDETLRRAVEIKNGVIQNPAILRFQNRAHDYPHRKREA